MKPDHPEMGRILAAGAGPGSPRRVYMKYGSPAAYIIRPVVSLAALGVSRYDGNGSVVPGSLMAQWSVGLAVLEHIS